MEEKRNKVGKVLACLLLCSKGGCTIRQLEDDYRNEEGHSIPYQEFDSSSAVDFFRTIPGHVRLSYEGGQHFVYPVVTEKTQHIRNLVARQKPPRTSSRNKRSRPSPYYQSDSTPRPRSSQRRHKEFDRSDVVSPRGSEMQQNLKKGINHSDSSLQLNGSSSHFAETDLLEMPLPGTGMPPPTPPGASVVVSPARKREREAFQHRWRRSCVTEHKEDLFKADKTMSLAHCVGADMRMKKGISVQFKKRFKSRDELLQQRVDPGGVAYIKDAGRFIFYMVTKWESWERPTYKTIERSLIALHKKCKELNVTQLAMPRIGCGLDKLRWNRVKDIIDEVFTDEFVIKIYNLKKKRRNVVGERRTPRQEPRQEVVRRPTSAPLRQDHPSYSYFNINIINNYYHITK